MKKLIYILALVAPLIIAGCVTPDIQTPREGIAACYFTVRTAFNTAADVKARGALPVEQEKKVLALGDQALAACDAARLAISAGDLSKAEGQLAIANAALIQLEAWLKSQGAKP